MLASIPKRKKIRTVLIIILSRAVDNLTNSISGSIEEVLSNQIMTANGIMAMHENGWQLNGYDAVWSVIEQLDAAYEGQEDPSSETLESLSGDLATALANAGL